MLCSEINQFLQQQHQYMSVGYGTTVNGVYYPNGEFIPAPPPQSFNPYPMAGMPPNAVVYDGNYGGGMSHASSQSSLNSLDSSIQMMHVTPSVVPYGVNDYDNSQQKYHTNVYLGQDFHSLRFHCRICYSAYAFEARLTLMCTYCGSSLRTARA